MGVIDLRIHSLLGHHLRKLLSEDVGVNLTPGNLAFVSRVEQFVVWAGRYAAPKTGLVNAVETTIGSEDRDQLHEILSVMRDATLA